MNNVSVVLKIGLVFTLFCFSMNSASAQLERKSDWSAGPILSSSFFSTIDVIGQRVEPVPQAGLFASYAKNLNTFFDLKYSGSLLAGFSPNNVINVNEGRQKIAEISGQRSIAFDLTPVYYTNPDRVGYLPAKYLFYVGLGVGFSFHSLSMGMLESTSFGGGEYGNEVIVIEASESRFSVLGGHVPVVVGTKQNKRVGRNFGIEVRSNLSFSSRMDDPGQNTRLASWLEGRFFVDL